MIWPTGGVTDGGAAGRDSGDVPVCCDGTTGVLNCGGYGEFARIVCVCVVG